MRCETRVLTILAALASSQPAILETHIKMMRASGIPLKAKPLTQGNNALEVFEEALGCRPWQGRLGLSEHHGRRYRKTSEF